MEDFKASTQYGDWGGKAAADDQLSDLRDWLRNKGLMKPDEFLIAVTLHVLEHRYTTPYIHAFVFIGDNFESVKKALEDIEGPIPVREIKVELTTEEFFGFFKQFSVVLTWHGLPLEGRDYDAAQS